MIVSDLPAKELLSDRLRPVPKGMKQEREYSLTSWTVRLRWTGPMKAQPHREEQQVIVEGTKVQMGKAMSPDKTEKLADEAAVRAVRCLDEKVGLGPALFRRTFTGKVMV